MPDENTDCKRKTCNESGQVKCMECNQINACPEPKDADARQWRKFRTGK